MSRAGIQPSLYLNFKDCSLLLLSGRAFVFPESSPWTSPSMHLPSRPLKVKAKGSKTWINSGIFGRAETLVLISVGKKSELVIFLVLPW